MTRSTARTQQAVVTKVVLGSHAESPKRFGPQNVRQFSSSADGVWHPDSLTPALFWNGGAFAVDARQGYFNPFGGKVPNRATSTCFTEQLPQDHRKLQWAMPQYGHADTSPTRGNQAESKLSSKPTWMTKMGFLTFGALRAFPLQQVQYAGLLDLERPHHHRESIYRPYLPHTNSPLYRLSEIGHPPIHSPTHPPSTHHSRITHNHPPTYYPPITSTRYPPSTRLPPKIQACAPCARILTVCLSCRCFCLYICVRVRSRGVRV